MRKTRFSFGRAVLLSASVIFSVSLFAACSQDDDEEFTLPAGVYRLSDSDPIAKTFNGNFGDAKFSSNFAWSTACSCTKLDSVEGLNESTYHTMTAFDWDELDYVDTYYKKDSEPVYVVYNTFTDADITDGIQKEEIDKHSGVVIFKAKHSPWGSPAVGCYYGVKFQFFAVGEETKDAPEEERHLTTQYSDKLLIEGGSNSDYNNVTSLTKAILMFGFYNTDYFSEENWTRASSGASIKTDDED